MLTYLSHVQLFATPRTVAHQAPLCIRFSWQEYQTELLCPPPRDLPDPGIEPMSPASPALLHPGFFTAETSGKDVCVCVCVYSGPLLVQRQHKLQLSI